jgi:hypothetical protein
MCQMSGYLGPSICWNTLWCAIGQHGDFCTITHFKNCAYTTMSKSNITLYVSHSAYYILYRATVGLSASVISAMLTLTLEAIIDWFLASGTCFPPHPSLTLQYPSPVYVESSLLVLAAQRSVRLNYVSAFSSKFLLGRAAESLGIAPSGFRWAYIYLYSFLYLCVCERRSPAEQSEVVSTSYMILYISIDSFIKAESMLISLLAFTFPV